MGLQPSGPALLDPTSAPRKDHLDRLALVGCPRCGLIQLDRPLSPRAAEGHGHAAAASTTIAAHERQWAIDLVSGAPDPGLIRVMDVDCGDGHLLSEIARASTIAVELVGIAPNRDSAVLARRNDVKVLPGPLGREEARALVDEGWQADLVIANHAVAHVDDPIDLLRSIRAVLAPGGRLAIEAHHVLGIVQDGQFDVVSPAHAVYPALADMLAWLSQTDFDVVEATLTPTYGGSVRLLATAGAAPSTVSKAAIDRGIGEILSREMAACVGSPRVLQEIGQQAKRAASELRSFLVARRAEGSRVIGYGAPARASLLLNLAGIDPSLLPYTVDANPTKQGRVLAGNRIPVRAPNLLETDRPDYVVVLAWTLFDEISVQLTMLRHAGTRLVVAVPSLQVMD